MDNRNIIYGIVIFIILIIVFKYIDVTTKTTKENMENVGVEQLPHSLKPIHNYIHPSEIIQNHYSPNSTPKTCHPIEHSFYSNMSNSVPIGVQRFAQPSNVINGTQDNREGNFVRITNYGNIEIVDAKYTPTPDEARFPTVMKSWYPASQSFLPFRSVNPEQVILNYNMHI